LIAPTDPADHPFAALAALKQPVSPARPGKPASKPSGKFARKSGSKSGSKSASKSKDK
jgi:hypothetical protein